jgi:hypothetical protein
MRQRHPALSKKSRAGKRLLTAPSASCYPLFLGDGGVFWGWQVLPRMSHAGSQGSGRPQSMHAMGGPGYRAYVVGNAAKDGRGTWVGGIRARR